MKSNSFLCQDSISYDQWNTLPAFRIDHLPITVSQQQTQDAKKKNPESDYQCFHSASQGFMNALAHKQIKGDGGNEESQQEWRTTLCLVTSNKKQNLEWYTLPGYI